MNSKNFKRIIGCGAGGFCLALSGLGAPPPFGVLAAAARGLGGVEKSVGERLAAWLWETGGAGALSLVLWLVSWAVWSLAFFLFFTVLGMVEGRLKFGFVGRVGRGLGWVVAVAGLVVWILAMVGRGESGQFPVEFVRETKGANLFANPGSYMALTLYGKVPTVPVEEAAVLSRDPSAWRERARAEHWDTVLLTGPSDEFRPLLNHLLGAPDWRLSGFSEHGWVFARDGGLAVTLPDPEALELVTARRLARLSDRFETMGETRKARVSIVRALELAPRDPQVHLFAARFAASLKRWHDALKHAESALRLGPPTAAALATKALAALESGDLETARQAAVAALRKTPNDQYTLFLLAKICRADNDIAAEIDTLTRLVQTAKKQNLPAGPALAYLGQARAKSGDAPRAAAAYREALASPDLDPAQKEALREALTTVESHLRPNQ